MENIKVNEAIDYTINLVFDFSDKIEESLNALNSKIEVRGVGYYLIDKDLTNQLLFIFSLKDENEKTMFWVLNSSALDLKLNSSNGLKVTLDRTSEEIIKAFKSNKDFLDIPFVGLFINLEIIDLNENLMMDVNKAYEFYCDNYLFLSKMSLEDFKSCYKYDIFTINDLEIIDIRNILYEKSC